MSAQTGNDLVPRVEPRLPSAPAVDDAATRLALQRLAASRDSLRRMAAESKSTGAKGEPGYKPRSLTMRALLAVGGKRVPWLGTAYSAWSMLRAFRRKP